MQTIPLQAVPSQIVKAVLGGQNCQISVYQKNQGMFVDVGANGAPVVSSILAHNAVPLVCIQYAGFQGNLVFIDTQGTEDPLYTGLGARWNLVYLTAAEAALV